MQRRTEWRAYDVVQDLRGSADHHHLVAEKFAAAVIRLPTLRIEDLPDRARRIGVVRTETDGSRPKIRGHTARLRPFSKAPRAERDR